MELVEAGARAEQPEPRADPRDVRVDRDVVRAEGEQQHAGRRLAPDARAGAHSCARASLDRQRRSSPARSSPSSARRISWMRTRLLAVQAAGLDRVLDLLARRVAHRGPGARSARAAAGRRRRGCGRSSTATARSRISSSTGAWCGGAQRRRRRPSRSRSRTATTRRRPGRRQSRRGTVAIFTKRARYRRSCVHGACQRADRYDAVLCEHGCPSVRVAKVPRFGRAQRSFRGERPLGHALSTSTLPRALIACFVVSLVDDAAPCAARRRAPPSRLDRVERSIVTQVQPDPRPARPAARCAPAARCRARRTTTPRTCWARTSSPIRRPTGESMAQRVGVLPAVAPGRRGARLDRRAATGRGQARRIVRMWMASPAPHRASLLTRPLPAHRRLAAPGMLGGQRVDGLHGRPRILPVGAPPAAVGHGGGAGAAGRTRLPARHGPPAPDHRARVPGGRHRTGSSSRA